MRKINFKKHIFKTAGAAAGLISGMGIFGLVFGLIAGTFIDQLGKTLLQRKKIILFLQKPDETPKNQICICSAAVITGRFLCKGDPLKMGLLSTLATTYFPELPGNVLSIAAELENKGQLSPVNSISGYFKTCAEDEHKTSLAGLIKACGCSLNEENVNILNTAGMKDFFPFGVSGENKNKADDFAILGLEPGTESAEIKRTYRRLAAQFHPDSGGSLTSKQQQITGEAFIRIKEAYERLVNED